MSDATTVLCNDENAEISTLQKEFIYYSNLLANYESIKPKSCENVAVKNSIQVQNVPYSGPGCSTFKVIKNPQIGNKNSSITNWRALKPNTNVYLQGKRSVLPNSQSLSLKTWVIPPKKTSIKVTKQILPLKVTASSKRKVIYHHNLNNSNRTVLCNSYGKHSKIRDFSINSVKPTLESTKSDTESVKSVPQDLITEIITLTKRLKQTSGNLSTCNKIKPTASNSKVNMSLNTTLSNKDSNSHKFPISTVGASKIICRNHTNLIQVPKLESGKSSISGVSVKEGFQDSKINSKLLSASAKEPSVMFSACGEKKDDGRISSQSQQNGKEKEISLNKEDQCNKNHFVGSSISKIQMKAKSIRTSTPKSLSAVTPFSKSLPSKKFSTVTKKNPNVRRKLVTSKYKVINDRILNVNVSKQEILKNKYMTLNAVQMNRRRKLSIKFDSLNDIHTKTSVKKCRRKLNSKYKIINKTISPENVVKSCTSKICKKSKQTSQIKKLHSAYKLINDNITLNTGQDLCGLSGSNSKRKINQKQNLPSAYRVLNSSSPSIKISPKIRRLNLVKTVPKKSHNLGSKYKIVNKSSYIMPNKAVMKSKVISRNKLTYIRKSLNNSAKKSKLIFMKKNMNTGNALTSYLPNNNCMLLKRVYKSKNAIINKNINATSHMARLIKTKYFALNRKRPISSQRHTLHLSSERRFGVYNYPRRSNFKGQIMAFSPRANRHYKSTSLRKKALFCKMKHNTGGFTRRKISASARSLVLIIRGERFAIGSSGKTLKKLSTSSPNKNVPKKIMFHGKAFVRTSSNTLAATTPITKTLASRVLHRSINRVLTASIKKKLTKVNRYCMFYNRFGRCNKGVKCSYIHDPSKIAVCTRFLRGTCKIDGCPFSHEICPGKMALCPFFLLGSCNKSDCPYRHEVLSPNSELCKAFVQGYCANGKQCKKAHILICPQYIQGTCEKGDACAFPHPPQKAKKNIQQDRQNGENGKESEELVEKVTRYFQPFIDLSSKVKEEATESINVVIPRLRTLPEQPSFIPLYDTSVSCVPKNLACQQQPSFIPLSLSFDETA